MSDYFVYYTESNIVCLIIFGIMLVRDLINRDRQEKQLKYDRALTAFMAYFISDTVWAAILDGVLPKTLWTVVAINLVNFVLIALITYHWLGYVMAVEQAPHRNRRINRFAVAFPSIVVTVAIITIFLIFPHVLITENLEIKQAYYLFQSIVPAIYIAAVLLYSLKKARKEKNRYERRQHLYVGLFPLTVVVAAAIQVLLLPNVPVFCYGCTIMMLIFYIQSMEGQISIDPLTRVSNRAQLMHYLSQDPSRRDGRKTFVLMFDVNDFKLINDTFGHSEGDRALILIAESLNKAAKRGSMPFFLGRYGGDEFILVVHAEDRSRIDPLVEDIRSQIVFACKSEHLPYTISVGVGVDELLPDRDSFQKCIQRADHKLYLDKEYCKINGTTTKCG